MEGHSVKPVNIHTLKLPDTEGILQEIQYAKLVFKVVEHNINGALGGAIEEVLVENTTGIPLRRIGLKDCFVTGCGAVASIG